jgi:ribosomal protein S18 acetylase RimI-like enzyme
MNIRPAIEEDCPRLMELIKELAVYEKAPEAVTVDFNHFVESGFGKSPVWWAFVAEDGGVIQGFALYYIRYSTWKGQRLYLEDLIVTEEARGMGLGKKLLDRVIEEARAREMVGVSWQVLDWNEPAISFYKRYGVVLDEEWINCHVHF